MSELIEINEDNCVLSDTDITIITEAFSAAKARWNSLLEKTKLPEYLDEIFLKINKLNEMAKNNKIQNKINDDMHVCTGEPPF